MSKIIQELRAELEKAEAEERRQQREKILEHPLIASLYKCCGDKLELQDYSNRLDTVIEFDITFDYQSFNDLLQNIPEDHLYFDGELEEPDDILEMLEEHPERGKVYGSVRLFPSKDKIDRLYFTLNTFSISLEGLDTVPVKWLRDVERYASRHSYIFMLGFTNGADW